MSEKKKRNIIIFSLCGVLLLMTIGYAAFNTLLTINGTTSISSNWDIKITGITNKDIVGDASDEESQVVNDLSATFKANLVSPGDSITYDITVENKGNINAELDSIDVSENTNENIKIETSGITEGDKLNANSLATLSVKITYSDDVTSQPDNLETEVTITLNYVQEGMRTPLPEAIDFETESTTNSITVTATKINGATYEFKKDTDEYINNGKNNVYTFNELTHNINHNIQVKVSKDGKTLESEAKPIRTNTLPSPSVSVSYTNATITYPSGCADGTYTCSYTWSGGKTGTTLVTSTSVSVSGDPGNIVTAEVSDGYNKTTHSGTLTGWCFVAGTKVWAEKGLINIEDLKIGDKVYSYNEKTKKVELKPILAVWIHKSSQIVTLRYDESNKIKANYNTNKIEEHFNAALVNQKKIKCSLDHPYYVIDKGWIDAKYLQVGDKVLTANKKAVIITNVRIDKVSETKLYNISVADNHNYYVSPELLLVHNGNDDVYLV